jgi:hypothetical protein
MKHKINVNFSSNQDILSTLKIMIKLLKIHMRIPDWSFYDNSNNDLIKSDASLHPALITANLLFI